MGKSRAWCFTNFDIEFDYSKVMDKLQYLGYGLETCPTTGKNHHQGWMYFKNPQGSVKNVAALLGKCHVEKINGSLAQNEAYCSKEGKLTEFGDKPAQGNRTDIDKLVDQIKEGRGAEDIALEEPAKYHQYGRTLHKVEDIVMRRKSRQWMTKGVWYTGPTGSGKSHKAFEGYSPATHYVKPMEDEWWDGYCGQEIVILNEFRGNHMRFSQLLELVDKWPTWVKRRGREPIPFLAKEVRVASVLHPEDAYMHVALERDSIEQLHRRFEVIILASGPTGILEQKCSEGNTETSEPKRSKNLMDYFN